LAQADRALYRSKEEGRNRFHFHSEDLDQEVLERVTLGEELRHAAQRGELELQYQPQVQLSTQAIVGMEALVRWHHPRRGLLTAGTFISVAERTGNIVELGRWVLGEACRQMRAWRDAGLTIRLIAVNLSLAQLQRGDELVTEVVDALSKWGLAPADLEVDVTEGTLAQLQWNQNDVLPRLRELGVKIAIDNFGTEYSSFEYVRAYRVNHLKIAPSFVQRTCVDRASAAAVTAIVNFARDVGVEVIAQGVETQEQAEVLSEVEAQTHAQGFHFCAPVTANEAAEILRRGRLSPAEGTGRHACVFTLTGT
jgi:EAL domain-containing protein (putative c-di-GMP-specific phosphodiesterase class I)